MPLRLFLDTEFINLNSPHLLSIGMVSEAGHEFYAELDLDSDIGKMRFSASSEFARKHVLSQWGRHPGASCSDTGLGVRAAIWMHRLLEHVGQELELTYSDRVDADLLESALQSSHKWWPRIERRVQWSIVSYLREAQGVKAAEDASFAHSLVLDGLNRHHALADARALRAGFYAVHGASEEAAAVEAGIAEAAARRRSEQWLTENAEAINSMNAYVEEHGLPLGGPSEEWTQAVNDLAKGVLELISKSGGLDAHSTSELQELRRLAERVKGA